MSLKIKNRTNIGASAQNVVETKRDLTAFLNKDIQLYGTSVGLKVKEAFYAELAILLTAGLDIQRSLDLIEQGQKKKKLKALFAKIKENVINGASLSKAIKNAGKFFRL